jgi:serine protease Do
MMSDDRVRELRRSSVAVTGGSGVIWSADGLIVTNAHVLHSREPKVTLDDGRAFDAVIEQVDRRRDLAVLRVPVSGLPAATIGDSSALRPGQVVTAVGNPLGVTGAVTTGIIYAVEGSRWVQADVRLAPGNSGGLLANARGEVIGINTMIVGGLAMAVPSNVVSAFVSGEETDKPVLGITMQPVKIQGRPALAIVDVAADSLARRSGLMIGDVLLLNSAQLHQALNARGTVRLRFLRGGVAREIAIQLPAPERRRAEAHAA